MPDTLLSTTLAGVTASIAEPLVTYPLEYLKTREQLSIRPTGAAEKFSIPHYTRVCYSGCSAFVTGNALKAFVRFQAFNWATKFMSSNGDNSAPQVVVAGMITGVAESLLVVPFENIKTTMIESSSLGKGAALGCLPVPGSPESQVLAKGPLGENVNSATTDKRVRPAGKKLLYDVEPLRNFRGTVAYMYQQRGFRAFVQGFNPTMFRQVANSAIRFTSYNFLKQMVAPDGPVGLGMSVGLAGATSLIEVAVTQPIDVVKTRMQSTNGIKLYGNAMVCSLRMFFDEGPQKLWSGMLARWLRVWASGGIMFIVYEQSNRLMAGGLKENPFGFKD